MRSSILVVIIFGMLVSEVCSQDINTDLRIFGYFQNEFEHQDTRNSDKRFNSFVLQQLNLFFQKDIDMRWTALVNFELINSFSSNNRWGAFNLEEAWVRYRSSRQFNLKLGIHIPTFNNFNEIKNRTPLMPYIIRPLAYETAFNETVGVHEFFPDRAFVQAYGSIPANSLKLDYSIYLGNSPNIEKFGGPNGRSGVDSTDTFLLGGRVGLRYKEIKTGLSLTRDKLSVLEIDTEEIGVTLPEFTDVERTRFGGDLSFFKDKFMFESEFIIVNYDLDSPIIDYDKYFNYLTAGFQINSKLFGFLSNWYTKEKLKSLAEVNVYVPNIGFSFQAKDEVVLKVHYAPVKIDSNVEGNRASQKFDFYAVAISVIF